MGLISPGGENLLDFLELRQVLSTYDWDLRDPLWWPQERTGPMRVARGLLGIPLPSMPGPRPCVESVPAPEHSSPVLTWILGYFCSLPRGVSPLLDWGHARELYSRALAAVSRFPSSRSRDLWLSLEAFPRGFPMSLNHRAVPRVIVLWVDPRLEIRGSTGKTVFPGMDLDIWGTLGMVARPWSSSRLSCGAHLLLRCEENAGNSFPNTQGKDPSSQAMRRKRGPSECLRYSRASS